MDNLTKGLWKILISSKDFSGISDYIDWFKTKPEEKDVKSSKKENGWEYDDKEYPSFRQLVMDNLPTYLCYRTVESRYYDRKWPLERALTERSNTK